MTSNEKPRTHGAGLINDIDGESTSANSRASNRLAQRSEHIFGKSAPMMTNRDLLNLHFLHDHRWNKSKADADNYLRSQGFPSLWSREDQLRADRFNRRVAILDLVGDAS